MITARRGQISIDRIVALRSSVLPQLGARMKKNPWLFRVYRGLYYPNLPKYIGPDFFLKEYLEGI